MPLLRMEQWLQHRGSATLQEVALRFDLTPEAAEPMLDLLVRKGRVHQEDVRTGSHCAGCAGCNHRHRSDCLLYFYVKG